MSQRELITPYWPLHLPKPMRAANFREFAKWCYAQTTKKKTYGTATGALYAMGKCFGFGFSEKASWYDLAMTAEFIALALEDESA